MRPDRFRAPASALSWRPLACNDATARPAAAAQIESLGTAVSYRVESLLSVSLPR
jgi:hypothetical protein